MKLTFTIPKALWLTANRHTTNRGHRARIVRDLHDLALVTARKSRTEPVTGVVGAVWTVHYPKGVRVDKGEADNANPTTKALLDGLVDAGVIPDDGPKWIAWNLYQRGPNLDRPSDHEITLVLTDQEVPW